MDIFGREERPENELLQFYGLQYGKDLKHSEAFKEVQSNINITCIYNITWTLRTRDKRKEIEEIMYLILSSFTLSVPFISFADLKILSHIIFVCVKNSL